MSFDSRVATILTAAFIGFGTSLLVAPDPTGVLPLLVGAVLTPLLGRQLLSSQVVSLWIRSRSRRDSQEPVMITVARS